MEFEIGDEVWVVVRRQSGYSDALVYAVRRGVVARCDGVNRTVVVRAAYAGPQHPEVEIGSHPQYVFHSKEVAEREMALMMLRR